VPYRHPKTRQWYSDFMGTDPETGLRRRYRLPLGENVCSKNQAVAAEATLRATLSQATARRENPTQQPEAAPPLAAFSSFVDTWKGTRVVKLKPSTRLGYESMCETWLVPHFGDRPLTTIKQMDVEELQAKALTAGLAKKSVNNIIGCLSSMLEAAVEWGYLRVNPCSKVEPLLLPPQQFQFYTQQQSEVWLGTCARLEPEWYPLFLCGFRTGLRLGELFALRIDDIDFNGGKIHVRRSVAHKTTEETVPKSAHGRVVSMSPQLVRTLRAVVHLRGPLMFCTEAGEPLTGDMLKCPWRRITRASGLPYIRAHDMRHSFASQLVIAGAPLKAVQELLGHSDIKTTMRYAHLAPGQKDQIVGTLDGHNDCHTSATLAEGAGGNRDSRSASNLVSLNREGGGGGGIRTHDSGSGEGEG
jgi:integrase